MARLKHVDSFTSSNLIQRALDAFVTVGRYDKQLRRACRLYRQHRDVMVEALTQTLPPDCQFEIPDGGLFIWLQLPENAPISRLMPLAWQAGVTFAKGGGFHTQEAYGEFTLRLNFAANSPELIIQGITRLSAAIRECGAEN